MAKFYEGQPSRQVLSISGYFFSRPLGLVIFVHVRDCPFILVLNAPFRPKGLPQVFTCIAFALFLFVRTFLFAISYVYMVNVRLPQRVAN